MVKLLTRRHGAGAAAGGVGARGGGSGITGLHAKPGAMAGDGHMPSGIDMCKGPR